MTRGWRLVRPRKLSSHRSTTVRVTRRRWLSCNLQENVMPHEEIFFFHGRPSTVPGAIRRWNVVKFYSQMPWKPRVNGKPGPLQLPTRESLFSFFFKKSMALFPGIFSWCLFPDTGWQCNIIRPTTRFFKATVLKNSTIGVKNSREYLNFRP